MGDQSTIAFDAIVLVGYVMIYLTPGTEAAALANMAQHLILGELVIAAFELTPPRWTKQTIDSSDAMAETAGLNKIARGSTGDQASWHSGDRYALSAHKK